MTNLRLTPLGYQQITSIGTAASLTVPSGANFARISVSTAAVRWRDDGTAPTSTVGMPMSNNDEPMEYSGSLSALQFIAQSGNPALNVSYYRISG